MRSHLTFIGTVCLLIGLTQAAFGATVYALDPNLSDFTATVTSYATFIEGQHTSLGNLSGSTTYTPTNTILLGLNYPRVVGGAFAGNIPVIAQFGVAGPTNTIVVYDNIDHLGRAWDVFQYHIWGSNDNSTYFDLFDPISVHEADQPGVNAAFTLNAYTGTAPTLLNNTVTAGLGSTVGNIGYEEYFTFPSAYAYFKFLPSTLTLTAPGGENELELSAVGLGVPSQTILNTAVPEPAEFMLLGGGLLVLACVRRRIADRARRYPLTK
jgi:hypothetical protein